MVYYLHSKQKEGNGMMKNFSGQKLTANFLRGKEGFGGILSFFDDRMEFEAFFADQLPGKQVIFYRDIESVKTSLTCGIIPNGLTVADDEGNVYPYAVWHRKKIAVFLRGKAGL